MARLKHESLLPAFRTPSQAQTTLLHRYAVLLAASQQEFKRSKNGQFKKHGIVAASLSTVTARMLTFIWAVANKKKKKINNQLIQAATRSQT